MNNRLSYPSYNSKRLRSSYHNLHSNVIGSNKKLSSTQNSTEKNAKNSRHGKILNLYKSETKLIKIISENISGQICLLKNHFLTLFGYYENEEDCLKNFKNKNEGVTENLSRRFHDSDEHLERASKTSLYFCELAHYVNELNRAASKVKELIRDPPFIPKNTENVEPNMNNNTRPNPEPMRNVDKNVGDGSHNLAVQTSSTSYFTAESWSSDYLSADNCEDDEGNEDELNSDYDSMSNENKNNNDSSNYDLFSGGKWGESSTASADDNRAAGGSDVTSSCIANDVNETLAKITENFLTIDPRNDLVISVYTDSNDIQNVRINFSDKETGVLLDQIFVKKVDFLKAHRNGFFNEYTCMISLNSFI